MKKNMRKNLKKNALYLESLVLAVGAVGCGSAIEQSRNGWMMLVWTGVALVLAGLGAAHENEEPKKDGKKIHEEPKNTVKAGWQGRKDA